MVTKYYKLLIVEEYHFMNGVPMHGVPILPTEFKISNVIF